MKRTLSVLVGLVLCVQLAPAQIGNSGARPQTPARQADPRVKAALDRLGIKYEVDRDGDYKLIRNVPDSSRTQLVFIDSKTYSLDGIGEIREIWAPAMRSTTPFPASVANRLLRNSFQMKLGAWEIYGGSRASAYMAVFSAKVGAELDGDTLRTTIDLVMQNADQMEKELTGGKDDF